MPHIYSLLLFCMFFWCVPSAEASPPLPADDTIHINADRMNQSVTEGIYTAEGNVVVHWQDQNLVADNIRYEAATHTLYANGSVVLSKGATVLKGASLVLNTDTGRADMDTTLLSSPESGMKISSEKLSRITESEYRATSSEFTSCDMPDPSWKFGAEGLKVDLTGYATGRNVIFYVKDIPVLYIPWIAFPVVLEKTSGLLFPRFGYSKSRGVQLDIPLYLVISPSQDLQIDLDILTKRGVGTGLDYRYLRARGSEGHVSGYAIYDRTENRWRWQIAQEHKEIFSPTANLRMSINATSDRTFLSDFGEKSGDYNRQSNETIINTLKTWQHYAVTASLRYSEDLYAADNRDTLQTLPSFGIAAVRQPILSLPLFFDMDGSAANLYRQSAPSGQRLYLFPRITLFPFQSNSLQTTLFAGTHIRGYATDKRNSGSDIQVTDGDLTPEIGARISTSLTRIYDINFQQLKKLKHEIIPELRYSFVPKQELQRMPFYDYTDRMIYQNMVSLSVTNMIGGKFISGDSSEYRDISRIKVSADYALVGERRDLLTLVEAQRPWSDLILESDTQVAKNLRITFDSRYNLYENHLSTAVAGLEINDQQGTSVGARYQMARNTVEYFEGHIATKLIQPFNLSYTARYSFDRSDFLESVYAAEYRHKCWSLNLAVHQRPGNQSYTLNFNLAGLGSK